MQGFTDHSVEYVWSLLVRLRLGPISVRESRYQTFAWSYSGLGYPGPLDFPKIFIPGLVWSVPPVVCGRPLVIHGSLDSLVLAEMQKAFKSLRNFQRSSILNVVI